MRNRQRLETALSGRDKRYKSEAVHRDGKLYIGVDIGSTSSDIAVLNEAGAIVFTDYKRTMGKPIETARRQLDEIYRQRKASEAALVAVTGSAGRFFAKLLGVQFINEIPAQATAVGWLYPELKQATIIEMGGQDSKLIFLWSEHGRVRVRDFSLNTVCAAGTGSFLDQQAQRLGVDIEDEFGRMALGSTCVPRIAGRCSVFAKSDMIHLQQQATPTSDIIAGLCLALARNLKSNLGRGREFVKPIVFTGGVAANIGVVRALEQVFGLGQDGLVVPAEHFFTGAIGAVLVAKGKSAGQSNGKVRLEKIDNYLAQRGERLKGVCRRPALNVPSQPVPQSRVYEELLSGADGQIEAYLGLDVGSISTNVVVIDEQKRVLAKVYLMTAGRPLEAVRKGLDIVGAKVAGKVKIIGAASTGSGRYLTGDFIGADVVINEITAQAAGAAIVNPKVDTIFEIGGQDSKYISLENGVVVDFEMNHACAAGTGSFLEEQAQRLGINIDGQFAELAFESDGPIKLGERCTVFMESDVQSFQQQGARTSELVAGLSYSIVANYLNRVVGRRRIGDNICFQGGTAFNKAVWSAFEQVTGKSITVPDHHEVTGAIGAAAIAAERMKGRAEQLGKQAESKFRGFKNLVSVDYSVESFSCQHCANNCEVKRVQIPGSEPLYYGCRCDRYNLKKKQAKTKGLGAFEYRRERLLAFAGLGDGCEKMQTVKGSIGIPMALINWQLLPLFGRFFKSLGFEVVLSEPTSKRTIRRGVEIVTAQMCFPVKVAYGHIAELAESEVDYIFLPSIVSMPSDISGSEVSQYCPYVQSLPYQVMTVFADKPAGAKFLNCVVRIGDGKRLLKKSFAELGKKLGVSRPAIYAAMNEGLAAQAKFERVLKQKGTEILSEIEQGQKLFVLVSRPYNGCDEGLNLRLTAKLSDLGAKVIPMDMLDLGDVELSDEVLASGVYWTYGQKILKAAEVIKKDSRLFAIYLSNFGCGPDSFLLTFFKDLMSPKPCLQLELDEHSADAGVITRLEAFLESLKNYRGDGKYKRPDVKRIATPKAISKKRTLYIPYMSDCSYGVAACFRAYGQPAEVMPITDETAMLQGRRFTSGKECLPCTITTGDMLKVVQREGFDPARAAFFMPGGSGPCRFGMYNCMHRLILKYAGVADVPVLSPNQDGRFYREFAGAIKDSGRWFMKDMWTATVGMDLLGKVLLRLRPFAEDKQEIRRVYERATKRWLKAVENRWNLNRRVELTESIAEDFSKVKLIYSAQKPVIGVVGEIYVRSHPFANSNIIARLEGLGAACELASLAEWIYYTNFLRSAAARRRGSVRALLSNVVQNRFQHRIEKALAAPLEKRFGGLAEAPVEKVIELARPYMDESFEGEAILSIGKMVELYHQGAGGVVNVMPFCCMPSTVVSTQTMRISADCGNMPILNVTFDGQEDATLTTRLEAFVEQVRQSVLVQREPDKFPSQLRDFSCLR